MFGLRMNKSVISTVNRFVMVTMAIISCTFLAMPSFSDTHGQAANNQQLDEISQLQKQEIDMANSGNDNTSTSLLNKYIHADEQSHGGNTTNQRQATTSNAASKTSNTGNLASSLNNTTPRQQAVSAQSSTHHQQVGINESAFAQVATKMLPLSPKQIVRLHQMFAASQAAAAQSPGTPPKPTATSEFVKLAPGSTPPVIRLGKGFVTSVVFLDSTGAPWPIANYDIGDPQAFNIVWNKKDNTLMIQAEKAYKYGNLAVRLRDLNTPIMITLIPGQQAVDYRVDMRVPGIGPKAKNIPTGNGLPQAASSPQLLSVLDGAAPRGGVALKVYGAVMQAWEVGTTIYVRTRDTVLSPSWLASMASADGTKVYKLQQTPVLLVSVDGKVTTVRLEGF